MFLLSKNTIMFEEVDFILDDYSVSAIIHWAV